MSMKSGVTTKRDDTAKIAAAIRQLTKLQVLVGVPSNKAERDDGAPINNAQLAYLNNFGGTIQIPEHETTLYRQIKADGSFAKDGRFVKRKKSNFATTHTVPAHEVVIPQREFLGPGIEAGKPQIVPQLKAAAELALQGDADGAKKKLNAAGIEGQNAVRAFINAGVAPELAPSTLRNRRSRGRTGTTPLIDTSELRNSITYVVRQK